MQATIIRQNFKVSGIQLPVKPYIAGKCLYDIYKKNDNQLTAESVVETAKDEYHPLHSCFEWNNKRAGEQYRLVQARKIIACVTVIKEVGNKKIEVRAFINIREDKKGNLTHNPFNTNGKSYYITLDDAMQNDFTKAYSIEMAIIEVNRWMEKYKNMKKLSSLFKVIKTKIKKINK